MSTSPDPTTLVARECLAPAVVLFLSTASPQRLHPERNLWTAEIGIVLAQDGTAFTRYGLSDPSNADVQYESCSIPFEQDQPVSVRISQDGSYSHIELPPSILLELYRYCLEQAGQERRTQHPHTDVCNFARRLARTHPEGFHIAPSPSIDL